jgi:hypothetical protein
LIPAIALWACCGSDGEKTQTGKKPHRTVRMTAAEPAVMDTNEFQDILEAAEAYAKAVAGSTEGFEYAAALDYALRGAATKGFTLGIVPRTLEAGPESPFAQLRAGVVAEAMPRESILADLAL